MSSQEGGGIKWVIMVTPNLNLKLKSSLSRMRVVSMPIDQL